MPGEFRITIAKDVPNPALALMELARVLDAGEVVAGVALVAGRRVERQPDEAEEAFLHRIRTLVSETHAGYSIMVGA